MKLHLAPMEGVVDFIMRDFLTRIGGIDQCSTEFIRITSQVLPDLVFHRYAPELKTNSRTASGVPVLIQLLGSDPEILAANAQRAASLGAAGIDLNFGCPAKTVNRHEGGAVLLQYPEKLFRIVEAVRKAVPASIPVTAKMRLGFLNTDRCLENAQAIEAGGANKLTVHCRTRLDMYKPPAYWHWIPLIKEKIKIPIIANGDLFTKEDLIECQKITNCNEFMIGRAALQDPFIFCKMRADQKNLQTENKEDLLLGFFEKNSTAVSPLFAQARTKQMLRNFIQKPDPSGRLAPLFEQIKTITNPSEFHQKLMARNSLEKISTPALN